MRASKLRSLRLEAAINALHQLTYMVGTGGGLKDVPLLVLLLGAVVRRDIEARGGGHTVTSAQYIRRKLVKLWTANSVEQRAARK
jgi:hypothetical protein